MLPESSGSWRCTGRGRLSRVRGAEAGGTGLAFGAGGSLPPRSSCPNFHKREERTLVGVLPSIRDTAACSTCPPVRQSSAYLSVFLTGSTCPWAYLVVRLPELIQGCYPQASGCSASWTPPMPWERGGVRSCDGASSVPAGTQCLTPMMLKGVA